MSTSAEASAGIEHAAWQGWFETFPESGITTAAPIMEKVA